MSVLNALKKEMLKSNGSVRVVKVPNRLHLTVDGLQQLDNFLNFEFNKNDIMRRKSIDKFSY